MNTGSGLVGNDDDSAHRLLEVGSDLVGVTGGAAIGLVIAGPPGALMGAASGSALTTMLREFGRRLLGKREEVRVGAVAIYAGMAYKERIADGDRLRDDSWFEKRPNGRSAADEICEGTLLIAQREHEERKVEHYGYLLANLSFESEIDEYLANWLLQLANELTWTQLVLLAMIHRKGEFNLPSITIGTGLSGWTPWGLRQQLADLGYAKRELIGLPPPPPGSGPSIPVIPRKVEREPAHMELHSGGMLIYQLMWLDRIPDADIQLLIDRL